MKFIFTTNTASVTTYDGPSGFRYVIYGNKPFDVPIKEDIAFFKSNHRFSEVTMAKKISEIIKPPEPKKDIDELFKEELDKVKLKDKTRELILKAYISKKDFTEDLEEGLQIDPTISRTELNKLKFHFLKPIKKTKGDNNDIHNKKKSTKRYRG